MPAAARARFSVTIRHTPTVTRAISTIPERAWTSIRYPNAIFDEDEQRWGDRHPEAFSNPESERAKDFLGKILTH